MIRKTIPLILSSMGVIAFLVDQYQRSRLLNYAHFTDLFINATIGAGVLFCFALIGASIFSSRGGARALPMNWLAGVLFLLLASSAFIAAVNPYGRFPWNREHEYFIISGARVIKYERFLQFRDDPGVVMLGSSHTFSLSPAYIDRSFNEKAFNFSVGGGGPLDYLAFLRLTLNHAEVAPKVALVELPAPDLHSYGIFDGLPLDMFKYLSGTDRMTTAYRLFTQGIMAKAVSDSFYTLAYVRGSDSWKELIVYQSDGGGVLAPAALTEKYYNTNTKAQMMDVFRLYQCNTLNEEGMNYIDEMIRLGQEHKFSIVFFRSPLNGLFFDPARTEAPKYQFCQKLINDYLAGLAEQYPNVFFRDLTYYPAISDLGITGFIDIQHPNAFGAERVIDALAPEINAGLDWAIEQRSNISK